MRFIEYLREIDDIATSTQGPSGGSTDFPMALPKGTLKQVKKRLAQDKKGVKNNDNSNVK